MRSAIGKKTGIILGILILLLVGIRLALPYIVLHFSNKKLANLDGYYGHVDDIEIALYRGAYVIKDIYLKKVDKRNHDTTDFFSDPKIDLSVQWRALWEGKIAGEVEFDKPVLKYILNKTVGENRSKDTTDLIQLVKDFMPLKINRFAVFDGDIHYIDLTRNPKVDVPMRHVDLEGKGLTNHPEKGILLPASITMKGSLFDGDFNSDVKLDPLTKVPTFDLNANLTKTNLLFLNDFFKAYAKVHLKKGTMEMYAEFAARDGKFKGYVKPLIKDFEVKFEGNVLDIVWEAFVGTVAEIFENHRTDRIATKVPLEGRFTSPDVKTMDAIIAILKNAFIEALKPSFDQSININSVNSPDQKEGFFKKLFGKDKKETQASPKKK